MKEGEVAESKRRGEDAVDGHLDEVFVDAVDDEAFDDEFVDEDSDDVPASTGSRSNSSTATKSKASSGAKLEKVAKPDASVGLFERIARFIREVVAELRKVNWPSRNELITYTSVVVVFVVIMMSIVAGLDWVFGWAITHVFG
jgi:preprotein translocase subunit SecE